MGKNGNAIICVSTREASLKKRLRRHLKSLGFHKTDDGTFAPPGAGKDVIRTIHSAQRDDRLALNRRFISENFSGLIKYFASGKEVDAARISPVLQRISGGTWESDLFRLAALTWSVPVSNGFGRRLRYLVWDNHNNKLIGIIAIGDPVFNLSVRDTLIDWDARARGQRLVNVMDAYVLGSLPPYNSLLGGKMVACLLRSRDIYNDFAKGEDGETKTEASNGYVPLHPVLAERLRAWQLRSPYPAPDDFLFPSETKKGKSPLYASTFVADYLRPAAIKAGVPIAAGQRFGLHNLRHSLSNWLVNKAKADPKTVQSLLRYSKIQTTLDLYTQGDSDETLSAQGQFLNAVGLTQRVQ